MRFRVLGAHLCGAALIVLAWGAFADEPALVVHGNGAEPVRLSLAELRKLPPQKVRVTPEHRAGGEYECTPVVGVLASAGVILGKSLRGARMAEYLLVRAADGYQVVFALPELDPEFTDRAVLLCYLKDGVPMAADEGPLRLVVPDEKRPARWVRQVTDFFIEKK